MKLEALLFDVDGTLVDTEELHRQAFNQTFRDFGLRWNCDPDLDSDLLTISGGEDRIARYIDSIELPVNEKTRLRRLVPDLHLEKTRYYAQLIDGKLVRPRPGVARLVEEARRAGIRIGLASTSFSVNLHSLIFAVFGQDFRKAIQVVVSADQVARKKPAADIYELLMTKLRVPAAACVAFEDSANGLAAAKAARLFTIVTARRWTKMQAFVNADLVLSTIGDPGLVRPETVIRWHRAGFRSTAFARLSRVKDLLPDASSSACCYRPAPGP